MPSYLTTQQSQIIIAALESYAEGAIDQAEEPTTSAEHAAMLEALAEQTRALATQVHATMMATHDQEMDRICG